MDPIWVKIGDFGISKLVSDDGTALRTSHVGTQGFQAPEVLGLLDDASETSEYTHAVDIWSLGCVLYRLKCREPPFPGGSLWRYCQGYGGFPESPLRSSGMTTGGIHILNELLAVDPSERPSGARALQSPWFLQYDDSSEDMKSLREERQELTTDRIPDTPVSSERPQKIGSRATKLHPDQKAAIPQAVVNSLSEHGITIRKWTTKNLISNSAFDIQSSQQGEQKDQSNSRMRQRDPVNLEKTTQNDFPRLPHGTTHAKNTIGRWTQLEPQLREDGTWIGGYEVSEDVEDDSEGSSLDENRSWSSNPSSDMEQQAHSEHELGSATDTNDSKLEQRRSGLSPSRKFEDEMVTNAQGLSNQTLESDHIEDVRWQQPLTNMVERSQEQGRRNEQQLEDEPRERLKPRRSLEDRLGWASRINEAARSRRREGEEEEEAAPERSRRPEEEEAEKLTRQLGEAQRFLMKIHKNYLID